MKEFYSQQDLVDFEPRHDVFVGIDSDGCVFDSMSVKQRIFHTEIINFWGLHEAEAEVREIAEWVSLFSPWRGLNRFQLILWIFKALNESGTAQVDVATLEAFVSSGVPLSADELAKRVDVTGDAELQKVLDWSKEVSRQISKLAEMPVFDEVVEGLKALQEAADMIVVSQTTEDALIREWRNASLEPFIDVIAGAELGSKQQSLTFAAVGRYPLDRILMIGDAPGDLEAAQAVGCLFFPIIPGDETSSWIELRNEALDRLKSGTFSGIYQDKLITRFNTTLSETPPYER